MASPTAGRAAQRHAAALESMQRGQWEAALSELNKATFLRSDGAAWAEGGQAGGQSGRETPC